MTSTPYRAAVVAACLGACLLVAPTQSGDGGGGAGKAARRLPVLYANTFARPAKLTKGQRSRVLQVSEQIAPPAAAVWFALVSGPGCFAGDRIQVFYRPTTLDPEIRRGPMAYLGLVAELQDDSVDRFVGSFAQVPRSSRGFPESLSIPRLRDVPFRVEPEVDSKLIVDAVHKVRRECGFFRHEHLGSLVVEADTIEVTTGTTTGRIATLRPGPDGSHAVGCFGLYSGG